jgi:hypothetical protein
MKPIPEGFVLLAKYDERVGVEHKSGPRGDYQRLLRELGKDSPCIAAYKDGGQWVAREADVLQFLERCTKQSEMPKKKKADADMVRGVVVVLERIAEALEAMATQPRNDSQTPGG